MANPNPVKNGGFDLMSEEDHKKASAKGGKNKGEAYRKRKQAKEILDVFLSMPLKKRKEASIEEIKAFEELKGKNITVNEAIQLKQIQKALNGDLASATYVRDTVGEKPKEQVDVNAKSKKPFEGRTTEELKKFIDQNENENE